MSVLKIKRPSFLFFLLEDSESFDIPSFLRGEIKIGRRSSLCVLSTLSESRVPITREDLISLTRLSMESWVEVTELEFPALRLRYLIARGVVLSDSDDPVAAKFREDHQRLLAEQWHPYAALYHFMSRENDQLMGKSDTRAAALSLKRDVKEHIEHHGVPPPAFHRRTDSRGDYELPLVEKTGGLFEILRKRETVRALDSSRPLKLEDFSVLLRYTFGCQGVLDLEGDFQLLHKTSPSGGSLHPIEAYPLVLNVESLETGFYHYDTASHLLRLIQGMALEEARDLATTMCRGQTYACSANTLVVMTARFFRNFWKYRKHARAYSIIQMDCGHLSQTFYLLATALGLGSFYTGALDSRKIENVLSLTPQSEAAIGVCGCGFKREDGETLGLEFKPFTPRESHT